MLILASSSPRRATLLSEGGFTFETIHVNVSEELPEGMLPKQGVCYLAECKAQAGLKCWRESGGSSQAVVLGADTLVVYGQRIMGKPQTFDEAEEMLQELSGKTHLVLTGVALISGSGRLHVKAVETIVNFRELLLDEIKGYVASGEPMDKAGSYGIQGEARKFVSSIQGSLTNVIGLPMEYLSEELKAWGIKQTNIASREVDHGLSAIKGFTRGTFAP